jgi:pimeloyl-ACP methyl ester carboxylesterase
MIGTSRAELWFIRFCILGLHYIAPLCILYCILVVVLYGFKATLYRFPLLIESIAAAETLFYLAVYLPYRHYLQRDATHPPPPSRKERRVLFQLCNDNITDPEKYLQMWFLGADPKEIKRENVKDFFLWAFFNRGGPPGDDDEELEEYISSTEKLLGRPIEAGRGKAQALRLTIDRVDMLHRSLIWYFVSCSYCFHTSLANPFQCVGFVDFLTYMRMLYIGFHFHRLPLSKFFKLFPFRFQSLFTSYRSPAKYTTYWHRPHTSPDKLPIVFLHGIGIGLYPYTNFLSELNSQLGVQKPDPNDQVGVLAIEIMPVSFRITHHALSREEMCAEISAIVNHHFPDQKFVLASHSYGTIISTHLLKSPLASQIGPVVLIDPVSIMLHLPDVAYNFTRRKPHRANEYQLYYFASMDMGVAHTLARHFFWNENVIWKKDMAGRKVTVSLGGKDLIVNTEAVGSYLSAPLDGFEKTLVKNNSVTNNGNSHTHDGILIDVEEEEGSEGLRLRGGEGTQVEEDGGEEEWKYRELKGCGIDVLWFKDLDHAQVFDKPATRRRLISAIRKYCEEG